MNRVLLDLNAEKFQQDLFALERDEAAAVLATLKRIATLDWNQLYSDRGLRWEAIESQRSSHGRRLYSLRITKRARAVGYCDQNVLRFVSLHPDHDSAYRK